jgi:putative flippase GtrA
MSLLQRCKKIWDGFAEKHQTIAQFIVFFVLSNGITVLQMIMMPLFKWIFGMTDLVDANFQIWHVGSNLDGSPYYVFNYAAGTLTGGGGGGLAYFLAVQITMAIAQVINFFAQRNITFKSNTSKLKAAMWYVLAYIVITIIAAAAQGLYKAPIYRLFIVTWGMGGFGETVSDVITMIINSAISFWVFFPIFKVIFRNKP